MPTGWKLDRAQRAAAPLSGPTGIWHVTRSLAEGRAAKESNVVIAERGWDPIDGPVLKLEPARW